MRISSKRQRNRRGALGSVVFLVGILIALLFACIAVDIAHFVSASTEMQSVADAAALMGAYDLQWTSTAAETNNATNDAKYMVQNSAADLYSKAGISIPATSVQVTFSSLNGGTNNACTVSLSPPIVYLFAPIMIGSGGTSNLVNATATAERLPIATGPAPPWFLETTDQPGPLCPAPLPSPAPAPIATFPTSAYVTFCDVKGGCAKQAPPILPTYWIDMGLTNLSNAQHNPPGIKAVLDCMGACVNSSSCTATNPVVIGGSTIGAVHGAYNSAVSNPQGNSATWTDGQTVLLPVSTGYNIISVYAVKLTGPYVANSFFNGQGVFGEFKVLFVGSADSVPGVTVFDPTTGQVFQNVGATVAVLVK